MCTGKTMPAKWKHNAKFRNGSTPVRFRGRSKLSPYRITVNRKIMTNLMNYLQDGASAQARATLMYLQNYGEVEKSWNKETGRYEAAIEVARWENCREQGYVVSLMARNCKQLNIAFFEHRNSDLYRRLISTGFLVP